MSDNQSILDPPEVESLADEHLNRLLAVEEPWYRSFVENIRDTFNPPKLPPLELTSKPVPVKSIWGLYTPDKKNWGYAALVVGGILLLLGTVFSVQVVREKMKEMTALAEPLAPYVPKMAPKNGISAGGGGGGDRSPTPASRGKLPKIATKQFVPPAVVVPNPHPKLIAVPTIVAPPDVPNVTAANLGDPLSRITQASNGIGSGGGIGSGSRGGVGSGSGAGVGPGTGGGTGGGVYRVGGGVSAPLLLSQVEPEYSEEARKAKFSGIVLLHVTVDEHGRVTEARVIRGIGLGLDEKAIEAVNKWTFKPGMRNGVPVKVAANIEVSFHLL